MAEMECKTPLVAQDDGSLELSPDAQPLQEGALPRAGRGARSCAVAFLAVASLLVAAAVVAHGSGSLSRKAQAPRPAVSVSLKEEDFEKQAEWQGANWVLGKSEENCDDACQRHGLTCYFSENGWPSGIGDISSIAKELGHECEHAVSAENTYDPFWIGPYCSTGPWKPPDVWGPWKPTNVRSCKAKPPAGTTRFCSCVQQVPEKSCSECNADCWKTESCCEEGYDACAPDPLMDKKHPDDNWWGSATAWEWGGVEPGAECMRDRPDSWEDLPKFWPATTKGGDRMRIKVLTYNLFWWNLFDKNGGRGGAAGHLVRDSGHEVPYDLLGFQECKDVKWIMGDAELQDYGKIGQHHDICLGWRNSTWEYIEEGDGIVGNDGGWVKGNKWGDRAVIWVRLQHRKTGDTLFFINHHGPLPLNSGGECGGLTTANSILSVINGNARQGDIIVLVGDFNSDPDSATIKLIGTRLHLGYHGESFGGIDNIFANTESEAFVEKKNLGGAGSDHDAISAIFELHPHKSTTTATRTSTSASTTSFSTTESFPDELWDGDEVDDPDASEDVDSGGFQGDETEAQVDMLSVTGNAGK